MINTITSQSPTASIAPAPSKAANASLWGLQILTAAAFLYVGGVKLAGAAAMVAMFNAIGLGQWFRYLTGFLEVAGAIGLVIPRFTFYAAALLSAVMIGAVITHLAIIGGSPAPAAMLLIFSGAIAYLRRPR